MTQRTNEQIKADKRASALRDNLKKRKELKKTLSQSLNNKDLNKDEQE